MAMDDIQYPSGFGLKHVVGWGTTGLVVLDESTRTVIKTPRDQENASLISRERRIYERFTEKGGHKGLLRYYGTFEVGIRLEYASNHHLRSVNKGNQISDKQRISWAIQIAEAMDFIHAAGIIHGDLTCANIFFDEGFNAKLADFAGSSIDGSPLLVGITASHESPRSLLSVQGDLFAFGCVLYEIMTKQVPHDGKTDDEIRGLYTSGVFPDTSSLGAVGRIDAAAGSVVDRL
ncbi:kinase-like domain-containing protein [Ilyonectria robusta]|uniref:kinase-like domain-containing protein n=1 Tax=Ilyonectria robusta TaxID=1079257 RepID=UPI001E8D7FCE|nr:kinase-like domain-containing protein [Ilyonectria robusta]KAH8721775.1 kinase-like domain-containing protein [Ilyonectria robusta]